MQRQFLNLIICLCLCLSSSEALAAGKSRLKGIAKAQIPSRDELTAMEEEAVEKINAIRVKEGLAPLKIWKELANCARKHSQNMASGIVGFGHDGFDQRADEMNQFAQLSLFGENVAYTYLHKDPVGTSVSGWMDSPPHRKNILGDFKETGIGIAYSKEGKCYLTQLFASRFRSR